MELTAKARMREISTWSKLKKEFNDGKFDDREVNTHQAESYMHRLEQQKLTLTPGSSQPEVFNVLGQLQSIERIKKENKSNLKATFIKTRKNEQVKEFYDKCGFKVTESNDLEKKYTLDLTTYVQNKLDYIGIVNGK